MSKIRAEIFSKNCDLISKEADRGAVLVAAALLDDGLKAALVNRLNPSFEKKDGLFDSPTAPLATFSAKIEMAYRLGLIVEGWAKSLHQFRKIRNFFAHSSEECSFDKAPISERITNLLNKNTGLREWICGKETELTVRQEFDLYFAFMAMKLDEIAETTSPVGFQRSCEKD